jgi:hypothetical protein
VGEGGRMQETDMELEQCRSNVNCEG